MKHTKEIACAASKCPNSYRTGQEKPGKYYYGRGYIQLTWLYNYQNCSMDMYGDLRLVDNPDLVSDTEEGAWGSAFWYWYKHVHNNSEVHFTSNEKNPFRTRSRIIYFLSTDNEGQIWTQHNGDQWGVRVQGTVQDKGIPAVRDLHKGVGSIWTTKILPAIPRGLLSNGGRRCTRLQAVQINRCIQQPGGNVPLVQ